ncbi:hypothetical protein JBE04_05485 [Streptomyces sp. PRKS01-29]|nr:hypothetical protein [Streptomyces sabulosicollis]MBI0293959.1 hypothetical protein [Streptomyces sabulosicollis]
MQLTECDGCRIPGAFLTAADLEDTEPGLAAHADDAARRWMPVLRDADTDRPVVPVGALGDRWGKGGEGRWNLDLEGIIPRLSLHRVPGTETAAVELPRFDDPGARPARRPAAAHRLPRLFTAGALNPVRVARDTEGSLSARGMDRP